MTISPEETFGFVATLLRFKTDAEEIAIANDTEFEYLCFGGIQS